MSPGERDALLSVTMRMATFWSPAFNALPKFEGSDPPWTYFSPDLVRSVDVTVELKRVSALQFAAATTRRSLGIWPTKKSRSGVRGQCPTTIQTTPTHSRFNEGERRIAEKMHALGSLFSKGGR